MPVKTLVQIAAAAFSELGLPALTRVVGNSDGTAVQALALLNLEGEELADIEGAWPSLRGEHRFQLVTGQEAYDFPSDLSYYRSGTGWDATTRWHVGGPLSDRQWQLYRSGPIAPTWPALRYRLMDGQMHFDPVPASADTVVFEYISSNWCKSGGGTPQDAFAADSDVPLLPARILIMGLKWRFLAAKGMNYAEERAAYDEAVPRKQARAFTAPTLSLGRRRYSAPPPFTVIAP